MLAAANSRHVSTPPGPDLRDQIRPSPNDAPAYASRCADSKSVVRKLIGQRSDEIREKPDLVRSTQPDLVTHDRPPVSPDGFGQNDRGLGTHVTRVVTQSGHPCHPSGHPCHPSGHPSGHPCHPSGHPSGHPCHPRFWGARKSVKSILFDVYIPNMRLPGAPDDTRHPKCGKYMVRFPT
jgi:hypothetical protein